MLKLNRIHIFTEFILLLNMGYIIIIINIIIRVISVINDKIIYVEISASACLRFLKEC